MEAHGPIDPHTGLPRRLEDFLASLDRIVDTAVAEGADLVIIAGDIYKSRDPTPTHQRAFARRILRLVQRDIPVFLLAGNHDLPNAVSRATSIDIFHELEIPGVTVARRAEVHRIETRSGPALIAALPWLIRSALFALEEARALPSEELERAVADAAVRTVENLAEEVAERRAEPALADAPAILVAHLHAHEARDGAERVLTVGTDPMIPINRVAIDPFDYVALGHMHAHQKLADRPPAVYPGSIERVNFGEEKEEKGFVLAEIERGRCQWRFERLPARAFLTIEARTLADDPTDAALREIERHRADIPGAVVRVRIQLTPQNQALFDEPRIRAALADAFWVSEVYREVDRPLRARLAGASVEGKGPLQLLEDYFAAKQVPRDERQRLRTYAARLLSAES